MDLAARLEFTLHFRQMTAYIHLAAVTGSAQSAALLYDICRRMPLCGGADHGGHHWVWLSAREAGEVINSARNTAAKYLDQLVKLGFLVREKLGQAQQFGRNRCWYYRPGPECPDFLLGKPVRTREASSCSKPERSTRTTSLPTNKKRVANAQNEQPHAIPDAEATKRQLKSEEERVFVPCPTALRSQKGVPIPPKTHENKQSHGGLIETQKEPHLSHFLRHLMQPLSPRMEEAVEAVLKREEALREGRSQDASEGLDKVFRKPQVR